MAKIKLHKHRKKEFEEIEYKPTSVKELLTEMKDTSELIVDLAYSALKFDSEDMAQEVRELEF
ncbi:potassium transporter TrkA, partial [bacterium]|nr:potassium transporter TrkA [bacterium]